MLPRILSGIGLLVSVLLLPFWVSIILAVALMFYFTLYIEAVALFALSDFLFGARENKFFGIVLVSSLLVAVLLLSIELLKRKLKFYP